MAPLLVDTPDGLPLMAKQGFDPAGDRTRPIVCHVLLAGTRATRRSSNLSDMRGTTVNEGMLRRS